MSKLSSAFHYAVNIAHEHADERDAVAYSAERFGVSFDELWEFWKNPPVDSKPHTFICKVAAVILLIPVLISLLVYVAISFL